VAKKSQGKNGDYDIGRGKPPPWTKFQPGQSGNPNGRPRKTPKEIPMTPSESELDNLLRAELDRELTINDGGKPKKIKARELVPRSQINAAIKGNSNAQRHVMLEMRELERRDAERARLLKEQQEAEREQQIKVYEYMVREKDERAAIWEEAASRGCEPDQPWPHPDDILLFPDQQRWKPRGPFEKQDLAFYAWCRAARDYLFAHSIAASRSSKKSERLLEGLCTNLWLSYDVMLPLRWQIYPRLDHELRKLNLMPMQDLRELVDERRRLSEQLEIIAGVLDGRDKETYKIVNSVMKPLLKRQGSRSLAEFEHKYKANSLLHRTRLC